ncbi:hypothetical protein AcV7_007636 [Taiwanofungus camphoratus]|nr:hypothetical protein AcV7_007636 [Antrodia cinnamomea]
MRFDLSVTFFNGHATDLLIYMQAPQLQTIGGGNFLQQIILAIVEPPIFWTSFSQAFQAGTLQENGQLSFAWLLLQLVSLPVDKASPYREIAQDPPISDRLSTSSHSGTRAIGKKIKEILSAFDATLPISSEYSPGGRHDNDHVDFREIAIVPTADEIISSERPFLRRSSVLDDPSTEDNRLAVHLDNQFRLLREDMIYEMREELQIALGGKKGKHRGLVIDGLALLGLHCGTEKKRSKWSLTFECKHDLPQFKKNKPKQRKTYLEEHRNVLKHQSLACLIIDGEVAAFSSINRDEDLLARDPPVVALWFEGEASTKRVLLRLKVAKHIKLIQIDTAIFSYEPILKALQETTSMPLSQELLLWKEDHVVQSPSVSPVDIIEALRTNARQDLRQLLGIQGPNPIQLDESQASSLLSGLTQRVSLIQGPPGTGKSFIGALLGKIIHDSSQQIILVVCYTNHALDQFLEDLLRIGIPESNMVRLGSKSTPGTASLMLQKQSKISRLCKADWEGIDRLKLTSERFVDHLDSAFSRYKALHAQYDDLLEHLEFEHPSYYRAFRVPESTNGMTRVEKKGRDVGPHYLLNQWVRGWNAGIFKNSAHVREASEVWEMTQDARQVQLSKWRSELLNEQILDFYAAAKIYNEGLDDLDRIFNQNTAAILKTKRIIACTTTAAAKYREDIQAAYPGVVLVEEAGEILESHVLTALGSNTKQLILIGDHQQLRPKVNNYLLTVEKGEGYDLNKSLFERLVLKGYPHDTLVQQHRMRPEISSLIRQLTYPDLVDAESTKNRRELRGVRDTIVFIDHSHPEDDNPQSTSDNNPNSSSSKQNTHEAEMVLKIVRYLAQQGYGSQKIVILTPYLGQLHKLQTILKQENDPVLNDLDSYDLVRAGLIPTATAKLSKKPIRLATIDNYQGEESDIVIVSLTRSNSSHDIGFMRSPERLNVMLSRARDALIMIGNAETFLTARGGSELWSRVIDLLKEGKHIYDGLPIKCERHPDRMALLKLPTDFDVLAPDGGCQEPCGTMLKCNLHYCPSKCHQLYDHSKMPCKQIIFDTCSKGHQLSWECHEDRPAVCMNCERAIKLAEKRQQEAFALQQKREAEEQEHARQLAKIEEEIAKQTQVLRDSQLAEERANVIRQKRLDMGMLAQLAARKLSTATDALGIGTTETTENIPQAEDSKSGTISQGSSKKVAARQEHVQSQTKVTLPGTPDATTSQPPSKAEQEWERQKLMEGASNDSIDSIMNMTGLEDVKAQILQVKNKIDVARRQNISLKERYNIVLLGNPGTGKTTVARHYAKLLVSLQILPGTAFVETTGSRLAMDGVAGTQKHIEKVINAGGGAIFIDEAYQLTGSHNFQGSQVLDFLLAEMENNIGSIVFILAGYNRQMEKFFEHNPGLTSRVPHRLHFADYTDAELLLMFERMAKKKYSGRAKVEDGFQGLYARIAIRRLGRGRGQEGFGNARALENLLARVSGRQADRLTEERKRGLCPDDLLFLKQDLIGPNPSNVLLKNTAWEKLQSLTGLKAVKQSVQNLFDLIHTNYQRELSEMSPVQMSLNRVFLGSPGTGKTTVAKLYGQILLDLGLLSNGEVVMKNPADFIGSVLGESESKTKAILAATVGKVLIIDEAYMLYGGASSHGNQADMYKTAVIDTIVAEVQSLPGEDRCVLLLGYKDQITEMFQNVNPGLSRRFAIEDAFHFEDFTDSELLEILNLKLKDQDLEATDAAKKVAIDVLCRARNRPNFGNAGEVENLLAQAKARYQTRQASLPTEEKTFDIVFQPQDFDLNFDRDARASVNLSKLFDGVVGCEDIITKLRGYQETARKMKARGMDAKDQIPTNFVMKGPPGTGKTTTARKMGQVYYDMGFLSSAEVVERSASDLVGQYVGQTGPKTKALLEKALGRVLFVDEAYRLGDGPFAKEAVDELVSILTQPRFLHKIVVILAGYDHEMNRLMAINTGLSSRFSEELIFTNMNPGHCLDVLKAELKKKNIYLPALDDPECDTYTAMARLLEDLSILPSWGNARDVGTLAKKMISHVFRTLPDEVEDSTMLKLNDEDALSLMERMLAERKGRTTNVAVNTSYSDGMQQMPNAPPLPSGSIRVSKSVKPKEQNKEKPVSPPPDARDAGVTDDVWRQLQEDKRNEELASERTAADMQRLEQELEHARQHEKAGRALAEELARAQAKDAAERDELRRQQEEARIRECKAQAERERRAAALKAAREEEDRRRKQEAKAQAALRRMGVCVAGFKWIKQDTGYRCAGGSHFVNNEALGI